jgi:NADH-quinone oxidoreductase subunit M
MSLVLLLAILVPLLGAAVIGATTEAGARPARGIALAATLLSLGLAATVTIGYCQWTAASAQTGQASRAVASPAQPSPAVGPDEFAVSSVAWLTSTEGPVRWNIRLSVGLDGLSVWLFGLSALLAVTSVLVSWQAVTERAPAFYALLLVLESGLLGVFAARDLIVFYIFFEFTLIPLFFLIGIWGYEERRYAAVKFFLYTLAGSVLTLVGLLAIVVWSYQQTVLVDAESGTTFRQWTFSILELKQRLAAVPLDPAWQKWVFLALFAGFAIKVPLFPLHTWLPLAHVQAPTAGSVILAGVLLKLGTYGFVRFSIPMLPQATAASLPWVLWLSVIGIVYGGLVALAQSDMKKLIAYSSVSHLGFCMVGVFALNPLGMQGGVLQMIHHGLATGALFCLVGMLYERYHTRDIASFGGLARRTPWLSFFLVLFTLSSIGLPGLGGFAGEFLLLCGLFQRAWGDGPLRGELLTLAVLSTSGVVLGAWYMLSLVRRTLFGALKEPYREPEEPPVRDLSLREVAALAPLALLIVWMGVRPQTFLQPMQGTLQGIVQHGEMALHDYWQRPQTPQMRQAWSPATRAAAASAPRPAVHAPNRAADGSRAAEAEETATPLTAVDRPPSGGAHAR